MDFYIKNKIIQLDKESLKEDEKKVIGDNTEYVANFIFDEEWNGKVKTARFINNGIYKDVNDLEVQIITDTKNKIKAFDLAEEIDKKLNRKFLTGARINRKNAWKVNFIDEENKENIVLQ